MIFQIDTTIDSNTLLRFFFEWDWKWIITTALIPLSVFLYKQYIKRKEKKETCVEFYENGGWIKAEKLGYGNLDGSRTKREELHPPNHEKLFEEVKELFESEPKKNILIKAPSLSGKTHFTIRFLKQLDKAYILQIKFKALKNFEEFKKHIPKSPKRAKYLIILMDDFQDYLAQGFDISNDLIRFLKDKSCTIWFNQVSSWETDETKDFSYKQLESFRTFKIEKLTDEEINIIKSKDLLKEKNLYESDGTIGSIFLPLAFIKDEYKKLSSKKKVILEIIKQAYLLGFAKQGFVMPYDIIYSYYNLEFPKSNLTKIEFDNILSELVKLNFLGKVKTHKNFVFESIYLHKVVAPDIEYEDFIDKWENNNFLEAENWFNAGFIKGFFKEKKDLKNAIKYYQKAIDLEPNFYQAWFNMGTTYGLLEEYEYALEKFQKTIDLESSFYQAWYHLGYTYEQLGKFEIAIEKYQKAIDYYNDYKSWLQMGIAYGKLGELETAVKKIEKAIEINPSFSHSWYNLGYAYEKLEQIETAIEKYQKAVEINPYYNNAWYNLGCMYEKLEQFEIAIEKYQKVVEINPYDYEAYGRIGICYEKLKKLEMAIKNYQKTVEINPNLYEVWNDMGAVYCDLKEFDVAIEKFEKSVEINPNYYPALNNMGSAYSSLEQFEIAIEKYRKAVEIDSKYFLAWFNMGNTYIELEKFKSAISSFKKVVEIAPDFYQAWENMGYAYEQINNKKRAKECFDKHDEILKSIEGVD